ncbi:hypothetical protein ASE95_14695 [Sphingomonas sp. Leaf231]|nr:hypothetical protein ASE95_14695 [Sphingomonas sp. Leaf231]
MLVLTGWTGIAHAAEGVACIEAPQANAAIEMAGDCDEVPADADKSYPHHHAACHGHQVATPAEASVTVALTYRWTEFASHKAPLWLAHQSDPALRPPQA